jgi:hypothetical protein
MECCKGISLGPEIAFQAVTGGETVYQIVKIIQTTHGARLEVINLQQAASFFLVNTTIATAPPINLPDSLATFLVIHRGRSR